MAASPRRDSWLPWVISGGVVALLAFVVIPVVVMAAGGWDMGMHRGGDDARGDAPVRGGMQVEVRIEDFRFKPGNLIVPVGASVTWTNEDSAPHDARDNGDAWETETLSRGDSETLTFDTPGEYDYYCTIHPGMKARLVVE